MSKTALLISTPYAFSNQASGGGLRSIQLIDLLTEYGFEVTHIPASGLSEHGFYDLICVVSFSNAHLLRGLRKKTDYLWYDPTDSWKVTRKSLFRLNPKLELIRFVRDLFYSRRYKFAELVTYCTLRDKMADNIKASKILCIPNKIKIFPVEKDYGPRFVFVGSADYEPNRKAIEFLIDTMVDPKLSALKLHIYGSTLDSSGVQNIVWHPLTADSELYGKRDIHLVPVMHGAGMKYKTLVPLSLNLRVISTIEGAVGIRENPKLWIVEDLRHFHEALLTIISGVAEISEIPSTFKPSLSFFDQTSSLKSILDGVRI